MRSGVHYFCLERSEGIRVHYFCLEWSEGNRGLFYCLDGAEEVSGVDSGSVCGDEWKRPLSRADRGAEGTELLSREASGQ